MFGRVAQTIVRRALVTRGLSQFPNTIPGPHAPPSQPPKPVVFLGSVDDDHTSSSPDSFMTLHDLSTHDHVIPRSIGLLTENKISVPATRLVEDLNWTAIERSTFLEKGPVSEVEDFKKTVERLKEFSKRGITVDHVTTTEILDKFARWFDVAHLLHALDSSPEEAAAVDEVMTNLDPENISLKEKKDKVFELFQRGMAKEARALAERTVASIKSVYRTISVARTQVEKIQQDRKDDLRNYLVQCGGYVLLGATVGFLGASTSISSTLSEVCLAMSTSFAIGSVLCLSFATFSFLESESLGSTLRRLDLAYMERKRLHDDLEKRIDEWLFHDCPYTE